MPDSRTVQDETLNPIQRVGIGNSADGVGVDETTSSLVNINVPHHEVHEGESFTAGHLIEGVADDAFLDLLFTCGTKDCHVTFDMAVEGLSWVNVYEDTTTSNVGSAVAAHARNRANVEVATATVTHTPTISGVGNAIAPTIMLPGGSIGQSAGTDRQSGLEYIFRHGKTYLVRITNKAGSAKDLQSAIDWYEETMS